MCGAARQFDTQDPRRGASAVLRCGGTSRCLKGSVERFHLLRALKPWAQASEGCCGHGRGADLDFGNAHLRVFIRNEPGLANDGSGGDYAGLEVHVFWTHTKLQDGTLRRSRASLSNFAPAASLLHPFA